MIKQLDSQTDNSSDFTSSIVILTHTPDANNPTRCSGFIMLSGLDTVAGFFELIITVGGMKLQPTPTYIDFDSAASGAIQIDSFDVPANHEVTFAIESPNSGDSAGVVAIAYLYDLTPQIDANNRVDVGRVLGAAQTANDNGADINLILEDTSELQSTLSAGIAGKIQNANLKDSLKNIIDVIESNRLHHTHAALGKIFCVDPVNGATFASGARGGISDPLLTIQDCHDNLVTDSNHDLIILVPGAVEGVTTHSVAEITTISKRYTLIRGPGRDFIITRTGSGDTFNLTGEGVELSGFQLETANTGAGHGVEVTADFAYLHGLWINATRGNGILINQSDNCIIEKNRFQDTGAGGSGDGIQISGTGTSSNNNVVRDNIFEDVQGDAVKLVGGTISDTVIQDNTIHGSTGWGINIGSDSTDAFVSGNKLGNNASGDIQDNGTTTIKRNNEQYAKDSAGALSPAINAAAIRDLEFDNDGSAVSLQDAIRLLLAVCTGKSSGGGTNTLTFRDINDSKDRLIVTADSNGNRTNVGTRDGT